MTERLAADAPNLERPGADLIAFYLSPDRHPAGRAWSAKHADTQRRLCQRFIAPVIAGICCQDIKTADMQKIVNAAPTAGEGARLRRALSAMVTAGIAAGYLTSPRLREVHWQPAGRPVPAPPVTLQGESAQFVDPAQIPSAADVARLAQALAAGRRGDLHELMAYTAAYTGLRQGELFALTIGQVDPAARVIDVDRKVIEVAGQLLGGAPKGRKRRKTIYPARTPHGYPLAGKIAARIAAGPGRAGRRRPTRSGCCSPPPAAPGGGPPTSTAASWPPPTAWPAGATTPATAPGPGTACATSCAPPPCSPGNSTPPTSPPSPATPTSAPPWTCTSAPPPASSTAPAQPPHKWKHRFTRLLSRRPASNLTFIKLVRTACSFDEREDVAGRAIAAPRR